MPILAAEAIPEAPIEQAKASGPGWWDSMAKRPEQRAP